MAHPEETVWVTEALQPQPRDIYDVTKLAAEELCRKASSHKLSCLCLRMSRCFPEDARLMAIYRLYRGIDINDVVLAHRLAITSDIGDFEIMNISSQTPALITPYGIKENDYSRALISNIATLKDIF